MKSSQLALTAFYLLLPGAPPLLVARVIVRGCARVQVHEKSILLPLLPLSMLSADYPRVAAWVLTMAPFSMYPLLKKDGLSLAYAAVLLLWGGLLLLAPHVLLNTSNAALKSPGSHTDTSQQQQQQWRAAVGVLMRHGPVVSACVAGIIHAAAAAVLPPLRYPYLFDALIVSWSFLHLALLLVFTNVEQLMEFWQHASVQHVKTA